MRTRAAPQYEDRASFYLLAGLLLFAPLFRAGNRPLPLLILELGAVLLLACALARPRFLRQLPRPLVYALAAVWLLPLLTLLPLPSAVWSELPGRADYLHAATALYGPQALGWQPAALVPYLTEQAWLATLPPLAAFIAAVGMTSRQLQIIVRILLGMALFQAVLGLLQYGNGADSLFRLGNQDMGRSASGTYINRNHLAGLLEMLLPLALALLTAALNQSPPRSDGRQRLNVRALNRALLYGLITAVLLLGLIFTQSRTGLLIALFGILLSALLYARRLRGAGVSGWIGISALLGLGLALLVGLAPVLDRFTYEDPLQDNRWSIYQQTWQATATFFPLGSGSGTFPEIFQKYQPADIVYYVNHAHNDYLETALETGLPGILLMLFLLGAYLWRWPQVWQGERNSSFNTLQIGAGIGIGLLLLHSLVDFNLHIPANALVFAVLAAVFFHKQHRRTQRVPTPIG